MLQDTPDTNPAPDDVSTATTDRIIALYKAGHSHREIARRVGTSRATVGRRIRASGVPRRYVTRKRKEFDVEEAKRLYELGYNLREVGEQMGVNYEVIRARFHELDIPIRSRGVAGGRRTPVTRLDLERWLTLFGEVDGIEKVEEEILAKLEGRVG